MKEYLKPEVEVVKFSTMEAITGDIIDGDIGTGNESTEWGEIE